MKPIILAIAIAAAWSLSGCATTHEQAMQIAIDDLNSAKATIDALAPSAIAVASVAAQGAEVITGNPELVPLTQQATQLAEGVLAASKAVGKVAAVVPPNTDVVTVK